MADGEFAIIEQLQQRLGGGGKGVRLGMGDDAAWLDTEGQTLVTSMDTLVAGRHFFADVDPADLGWKALAVNLSDLAAMGASPRWCLLSLALPAVAGGYGAWIEDFSTGWKALAASAEVALVGGDTVATDGPLTLSVTVLGLVEQDVMRRAAARPGDVIWVTGTLGDAAAALERAWVARGQPGRDFVCTPLQAQALESRRLRPTPRIDFGRKAQAAGVLCALDCSDGFLADLGHILQASGVRAQVALENLPLSPALEAVMGSDPEALQRWPLTGGDDYELILCVPPILSATLQGLAAACALRLTPVGQILAMNSGSMDSEGADCRTAAPIDLTWLGQPRALPDSWGHQHVF